MEETMRLSKGDAKNICKDGNHVSVFHLVLVIQCVLHICTADIGSSGIGMMFLGVCHVESGSTAVM
jgi:hypothetical protein